MIRFHNTLTGTLESFETREQGRVSMYTCGPTVYSFAHVGNFRTFVWEDLLRRFLEERGYDVLHIMNITDVDDKIIRAAVAQARTVEEITRPFESAFFDDLDTLGIRRAHQYPRATEHIAEMLELVSTLEERGLAYESDGSYYFRVAAFPGYGRLSGKVLDELQAGASGRVEADEYDKDDVRDFALWKKTTENEPGWDGPTGPGRPGWHIECSAMSMKYLGSSFDIHTGGVDNIFPHHENEIAQSQGATGEPLAHYWMHAAHLIVNGEKMAKSTGNFFTLRDLQEKGTDPRSLRYFLLSAHYRRVLDLTERSLESARQNVQRLDDLAERLRAADPGTDDVGALEAVAGHRARFDQSLDDDLNTAGALGALFEAVRDINAALDAGRAGAGLKEAAGALLEAFESIFGIRLGEQLELPDDVAGLVAARETARAGRDFAEADRLRAEILARGFVLEDTPRGTRCKKA